jgi:hypothetical protein
VTSRALLPDPLLSANVYCSGRLCEVIQRLVSPFWSEYRAQSSAGTSYLWVMRYARGGEHLKVRLHGDPSEAELLRDLLAASQAAYFARLAGAASATPAAKSRPDAPPIDAEDRVDTDHPDRTFLWTTYRRNPLSLGVDPFLQDDAYLELLTRCLGCGTEILLARLEAGEDGQCPHPLCRDILFSALLFGLEQLRLSGRERALYLLYHRDTLLRHLRKRKNWSASPEAMARVLSHLDLQAARDPRREELGRFLSQHGMAGHAWRWQADIGAWCSALRELQEYVTPLLADPLFHADPFAERPLFALLFKVFHGFINQIGLDALNEAFLLHLLGGVVAETDLLQRPVLLRPDFRALEGDAEGPAGRSIGMSRKGPGAIPIIVRIAGLPVDALVPFASDLVDAMRRLEELDTLLAQSRSALVERLHAEVRGAPNEHRRLFIAIKRDSWNGRSLRKYRDDRWAGLLQALAPLIEEVLYLEKRRETLQQELAAAYAEQYERERGALCGFLDDRVFLRGVALASEVLVENLPRLRRERNGGSQRRGRKLELSLLRYVSRTTLKLSPFSSLTATGLALVAEHPGPGAVALAGEASWEQRSTVRLQRFLCDLLLDTLLRYPAFRNSLPVFLNETVEARGGDSFRFIQPGSWGPDPVSGAVRYTRPSLVNVKLQGALIEELRQRPAGSSRPLPELLADLRGVFPSRSEADLRSRLDRLLEIGFLSFDRPWGAADFVPEQKLLHHLGRIGTDTELIQIADSLRQIVRLLWEYATSSSPSDTAAEIGRRIQELLARVGALTGVDMSPFSSREPTGFFYEDVLIEADLESRAVASLAPDRMAEALTDLTPLARLSTFYSHHPDFLYSLAALAAGRWPGETEVPFLDVFEAAYPLFQAYVKHDLASRSQHRLRGSAFNPSNLPVLERLRALRETTADAVRGCLELDGGTARLDRAAVNEILDRLPEPCAAARPFCAFLQPVDGERERWVLNQLVDGLGRLSSRYTAAMAPAMRSRYTSFFLDRSLLEDGEGTCEIVEILCPGGHTANVHLPQTRRVLVTPGHSVDLPAGQRLTPRDLVVRFQGSDRPPVMTDREGRRLLPVHLGGVAFRYMPTLSKFLALFGPGEMRLCAPYTKARPDGDLEVLDRHAIGDIVYRRRAWVFDVSGLSARFAGLTAESAFLAVNHWRLRHRILDSVFVAEPAAASGPDLRVKPQYINFTSPLFIEIFRSAISRDASRLWLTEALPAPDQIPKCGDGERLAVEIQLDSFGFHQT